MKQVQVSSVNQWRKWLSANHDKEVDGIWLVFKKKRMTNRTLAYDEAVEEALCFGWIDSIIKRIDDDTYCRKFTPRKDGSKWSKLNKERVAKLINEGRMTDFGLSKIKAAKRSGSWKKDPRPAINWEIPHELSAALARNKRAKEFFAGLAPTYQKQFIGWIITAKRPETKANRLKETLALLSRGEKLGLK